MKAISITIVTLLVLTSVSCAATRTFLNQSATASKQTSDIVFVRDGYIYLLSVNQKEPRKLIKGEFPSLSNDGSEVAYTLPQERTSPKPADAVLMLLDIESGKSRELLKKKGFVSDLRFAPDGDFVLFSLLTFDGNSKLEVLNTAGEESFAINEANKEIDDFFGPVWAKDGKTIYFHDMKNLFHVSFDGQILESTPLTTFTGDQDAITSSDWYLPSPADSNLLLFTQLVDGTPLFDKTFGEPNTALFLYDYSKKTKRRLTAENLFAVGPVWSPDGQTIYFTGYYDRNGSALYPFKVFKIKVEGTGLTELAAGETY